MVVFSPLFFPRSLFLNPSPPASGSENVGWNHLPSVEAFSWVSLPFFPLGAPLLLRARMSSRMRDVPQGLAAFSFRSPRPRSAHRLMMLIDREPGAILEISGTSGSSLGLFFPGPFSLRFLDRLYSGRYWNRVSAAARSSFLLNEIVINLQRSGPPFDDPSKFVPPPFPVRNRSTANLLRILLTTPSPFSSSFLSCVFFDSGHITIFKTHPAPLDPVISAPFRSLKLFFLLVLGFLLRQTFRGPEQIRAGFSCWSRYQVLWNKKGLVTFQTPRRTTPHLARRF